MVSAAWLQDLGTAIRRCIALDLQPLSSAALITSPRTQPGGGTLPDDINALAALLARQGATLVESLEVALVRWALGGGITGLLTGLPPRGVPSSSHVPPIQGQINTAREERTFLTAQLANRQAVLDELRHHLADHALAAAGRVDGAVALGEALHSGISTNSPSNSHVSPRQFAMPLTSRYIDVQQVSAWNGSQLVELSCYFAE